jgi:hypothetical protein
MFPDSDVAKGFGCGESKCARLARWGIAPHLKSLLTSNVNHADNFVLLFDENLNFENQSKQSKLLQIGMDGPNVNHKFQFHREMVSHIEKDYDKTLLDIGSCGLHILHGSLKNGMDKNKIFNDLESVFSSLHWLFNNAPSRKKDFTSLVVVTYSGCSFANIVGWKTSQLLDVH